MSEQVRCDLALEAQEIYSETAAEESEKESGITIHLVNNEYDKGQILKQYTTPLSPEDSADDIARKVHALEYEHYPEVIEQLLSR